MPSQAKVTDPARVPSERVARGPRTVTAWPPRLYRPSARPQAAMESEITIPRSPRARKAAFSTALWMWTPSQITSARQSPARAAPASPGSRWCRPVMALNRWVTWVAPAAKPLCASS